VIVCVCVYIYIYTHTHTHTDTHTSLAEYSVLLYLCISFLDDVLEVETCSRHIRGDVLFIADLQFVVLSIDHEKVATLISQYSHSV